jgi:hypothetical protein
MFRGTKRVPPSRHQFTSLLALLHKCFIAFYMARDPSRLPVTASGDAARAGALRNRVDASALAARASSIRRRAGAAVLTKEYGESALSGLRGRPHQRWHKRRRMCQRPITGLSRGPF